jgi:tetratricopeptide (TPR) repeat protein
LNNYLFERIIISKANFLVCLFLCLPPLLLVAQDLSFDDRLLEAHRLALNLQPEEALSNVSGDSSIEAVYIASLAETLELLITEDYSRFSQYEDRLQKRLEKKIRAAGSDVQFLQAELRLHSAFVYLKFGHELDAALHLRQAYQIAEGCRNKFPGYLPIRKTSGVLQLILGSVPDKYSWVLNLLNMRGSVPAGLAHLKKIAHSSGPLAEEGALLQALVHGFILSQPAVGLETMNEFNQELPDNRLALFLSASLALKDSQNELALNLLKRLAASTAGIPLHYAHYLTGEAYLQKGEYLRAVSSYRWFIENQRGDNYIKDAHYKMGVCYWLEGANKDALVCFQDARNKGKEATEADKSAARALSDNDPPDVVLSKIRYLTDGGYYIEAGELLSTISAGDLQTKKDRVEFLYRKARLAHKTKKPEAIDFYKQAVKLNGQEEWYFAPNACLQLGYLYQSLNRKKEAEEYFERALTYRRHAYKNSIDSKALSALAQLGRK